MTENPRQAIWLAVGFYIHQNGGILSKSSAMPDTRLARSAPWMQSGDSGAHTRRGAPGIRQIQQSGFLGTDTKFFDRPGQTSLQPGTFAAIPSGRL